MTKVALDLAHDVHTLDARLLSDCRSALYHSFLGYRPEKELPTEGQLPVSEVRTRGYSSFDYIVHPYAWGHLRRLAVGPPWPSPDLKQRGLSLYRSFARMGESLAVELRRELSLGSRLPLSALAAPTCSIMRLLHYRVDNGSGFSKAHTDYEMFSISAASEHGLQLFLNDEWIDVPFRRGCLVFVAGDALELASSGTISSPIHRVRRSSNERLSAIYFQGLRYHTTFQYLGRDHLFGDHLMGMLIRGAPHLATEYEASELEVGFTIPPRNPLNESKGPSV